MPRHLTQFEIARITAFRETGLSLRDIAAIINCNYSTVSRALGRIRNADRFPQIQGRGRPRITTAATDRRIVREAVSHRNNSASIIRNNLEIAASTRTVINRLHERGLRARRPLRAPFLSRRHLRERLNYARAHVAWTVRQWHHVHFSDESRYSLFRNDRRIRVWRYRGERLNPNCIERIRNFNGGSLMVWATISWHNKSRLVFIRTPPGLTSNRYINEILRPHVIPLKAQYGRNFIFMHDNAPPHKARVVSNILHENNINVIEHPANSPDLNPIEHIWAMLQNRLRRDHPQINNLQALELALMRAWETITQDEIRRCINMGDRLQAVINARGGNTRF